MYLSIFIHNLAKENFFNILYTLTHFSCKIEEAEKDIIVVNNPEKGVISLCLKLKEEYPEAKFGISLYPGLSKGLSRIAKVGEILFSEEVENQIIDDYEITSLGMLSIEGLRSQILVCRIDSPKRELGLPETVKPFSISRKRAIDSLKNLLRVAKGVLVVAPDGSGKTTFFDELVKEWDKQEIYRVSCPYYKAGRALAPITELVNQILDITTIEGMEERQISVKKRLKGLGIVDIGSSYLSILDFLELGEEESILEKLELKIRVELITTTISDVIKRISWTKKVVIIVEDVENMDPSAINFIKLLLTKLNEEQVYFIFSSSFAQINISGLKEYSLPAIDNRELAKVVEDLTGDKITLPATTPFHVFQYLALYEEEKKEFLYHQYNGELNVVNFNVPFYDIPTIIKRRLELLGNKKDELFNLAILGLKLNPKELPLEKGKLSYLNYFVQHGFFKKLHGHYLFSSPFLHQSIYNQIPDKVKRHRRFAQYFGRISANVEISAFHYYQAEDYKKAIEYLLKSADLVVKKGGYESGIEYYNQALELCQSQKVTVNLNVLVEINERLGDIYKALGDEDKALKYYRVVLDSYKTILEE